MEKRIRILLDQLEEKFWSGEIDEVTYEDLKKVYFEKLLEIEEEKASKEQTEKAEEKEEKTLEEEKEEEKEKKPQPPKREIPIILSENLEIKRRLLQFSKERSIYTFKLYQLSNKIKKKGGGLKKWPQIKEYQNKINALNQKMNAYKRFLEENQPKIVNLYIKSRDLKGKLLILEKEIKRGDTTHSLRAQKSALEKEYMETARVLGEEIKKYKTYLQILKDKLEQKKKEFKEKKDHPEKLREKISTLQTHANLLSSDIVKFSSILPPKIIQKMELEQKPILPLIYEGEKRDIALKEKSTSMSIERISAPEETLFEEPKSGEPPEKLEDIPVLLNDDDAVAAWDIVDKIIINAQKRFIGFTGPPLLQKGSIMVPILVENDPSQESLDMFFETLYPGSFENDSEERKESLRSEISSFLKIPEYIALLPRYIRNYCAKKNIKCPLKSEEFKQKIKGIIPFQQIKRENGAIIVNEDDINLLNSDQRERLAKMKIVPFPISKIEERTLTKKPLISYLQKHLGIIIEILYHPSLGAILVYETFYPNKKILDQILKNLKTPIKSSYEENLWYVRFAISKKLDLGEGDALKPENLVKFCLLEQIPLTPQEVVSGYLKWVFMGFVSESMKNFVVLKRNAFQKPIKHAYSLACKQLVDQEESPLGTAIGITIEENENGKELLLQYSTKSLEDLEEFEEEKLEEEEPTILKTLRQSIESTLCPETIIKYAIDKGIITEKETYNQLLELLGTKTVPLRKIIRITKIKIYVQQ